MDINIIASGSRGNAYIISDGETDLLLDAGIPCKALQVGCGYGLSGIGGCLITHSHTDHSKAAKELLKRGVDIYTSKGTIESCGLSGHRLHTITSMERVNIGTFTILPFDVRHDAPEPLGFLAASGITNEKLLYFTDTFYLTYSFKGLTHILCECNYDRKSLYKAVSEGRTAPELAARIVKSHMSLETLLDFFKKCDLSKVRQIYLLHLSDNNSNAERIKRAVQKLSGSEVYVC